MKQVINLNQKGEIIDLAKITLPEQLSIEIMKLMKGAN